MEKTIGGTLVHRKTKMTLQEMLNFKGNLNVEEDSAEPRYTCKETGAHFEFSNMCTRIEKMGQNREMKRLVMLSASSIGSHRKSSIDTKQEEGEKFVREESAKMNESSGMLQLTNSDSARKTMTENNPPAGQMDSATKKMLIIEEAAYGEDNIIIEQSKSPHIKEGSTAKPGLTMVQASHNLVTDVQKSVEVIDVTQSAQFNQEEL